MEWVPGLRIWDMSTYLCDGGQHLKATHADGRREGLPARHRVACPESCNVRTAHDEVANGEEDDGSFGVSEPWRINQERQHGEQATGTADGGPRGDPVPQYRSLVLRKEQGVAGRTAVFRGLQEGEREGEMQINLMHFK